MKLLVSQQNELLEIIESMGFSLAYFRFQEFHSKLEAMGKATILTYEATDYFYVFDSSISSIAPFYSEFCPGEKQYKQEGHPMTWEKQVEIFKKWLSNLNKEIGALEKWRKLQEEIQGINFEFTNEDEKFSSIELEYLSIRIEDLKDKIATLPLLPAQLKTIEYKLDHLTEMAKSLSKFDWKSLFLGSMVTIVAAATISPENAKSIWELIKQVFSSYILP